MNKVIGSREETSCKREWHMQRLRGKTGSWEVWNELDA